MHFGFTIYTEPVLEFFLFLKSCKEHKVDTNASILPSGISDPSFKIIEDSSLNDPHFY